MILFQKGIKEDSSINVVYKDILLSLLKERSDFKSNEAGLRKQIEEIRNSLRYFYVFSEGKKDEYQIDIGTRYGRGYIVITVKRDSSSIVYDMDTSIFIEILPNGQVLHKRVDYFQVLCDSLPAREHALLQWDRGDVTVLNRDFDLKFIRILGKSIEHLHRAKRVIMREKKDEYYWKISFEPPLPKGTIVKYENRHKFLRPYPMSMSEIRAGKMYQRLPFAYEGIGTQNEKGRSYLEIKFPNKYEFIDCGFFIESGFTGSEFNEISKELEEKKEDYLSFDALNANILKLEINAPILGITYSLKWYPPEKWEG